MDSDEALDGLEIIDLPPLSEMSLEQVMTYYTDDPIKAEAIYLSARGVYVSDLAYLNKDGHRINPHTGEIVERDYLRAHPIQDDDE